MTPLASTDLPTVQPPPLDVQPRREKPHGGRHDPTADPSAPTAVTGQYLRPLDGLRALAVGGVLAYHLQLGWASGGYLGVDLFFVLSGFLITSLLLEEWVRTAGIRLIAFWGRRARRLLPALFLMVLGVAAFVVLDGRFGPPGNVAQIDLSGLRGDALATLFYVANWHSIFAHQSYFAQFSAPSPLEQTWSLAIEEQFYLIWPPFLLLVLSVFSRSWRRVGLAITVVGAIGSALLMAVLYHPGTDPSRVYFGTDTRGFDLLIGAALAMLVAARPQPGRVVRTSLHTLGPIAAVVLGFFWVTAGTPGGIPSSWMFTGGFFVCAILAVIVIADVRQIHQGPLGKLLAIQPLRWIGRISYGIYLWHWPIFVYFNTARTGLTGAVLDVSRVALTVGVAAASFYLVEQPIRRHRFSKSSRIALVPTFLAAMTAVVVIATIPAVAAPAGPPEKTAVSNVTADTQVPGYGGFQNETPIVLPKTRIISPANPLRVMLLGDSVMNVMAPGISASLGATGEVSVTNRSIDGFGLSTAKNWRTSIPSIIANVHPDIILATWSWDDTWALEHPNNYKATLMQAVDEMLAPGNGVYGVIFVQFPKTGPVIATNAAQGKASDAQRAAGQRAWNTIVKSLPAAYEGKVMYLPTASSILLNGHFTTWLPPANDPTAPRSKWVRVRMIDNVHPCPAGVVRYADALLADLKKLFGLRPAAPGWWNQPWTHDARFNTPPGSCPNDHPPS
ncbi:MAG: acyltransferase [Actinobacteria bacterium]|nr:acyltransferase [Actinomycetota bacterium]